MNVTSSILIPCYNSASYLPDLFEGIRNQTVPFDEVICFDDCSSDNTVEVARELGTFVIEGKHNRGPAFARNQLAKASSCTWIHFHDSDDLIDPRFNELMKAKALDPNLQLLSNAGVYDRNNRENQIGDINYDAINSAPDKLLWAVQNVIFASMGFYFREVFLKVGGFSEGLIGNEDPDFHIRLLNAGYQIESIHSYLVSKLEHNESLSHTKWLQCLSDKLVCLEKYLTILPEKYRQEIGKQSAELSNYFYEKNCLDLSEKARRLTKRSGIKTLPSSKFTSWITSLAGINFYLWLHRRRVDLKIKK